ncbi:MAG: NAD(P)-dependent oxidoreductase, partial [Terriglobia bacterium]
MPDAIESVGFIGLGIMGRHMAEHILAGGYRLHIYNRSRGNAEALIAKGAIWHNSPAALAPQCDVIVTIVGYPSDVEQVYFGPDGLIVRAKAGSILIDATTSSPSVAVRIAKEAADRGLNALDAPVSGGEVGARDAKLAIMVGGASAAFARVKPMLERMGGNIALMGGPGAGQHTKMANQIAIASTMMGVSECLAYASGAGLDPATVLKVIGTGAASSFLLNNLAPKMMEGDYRPGFFVKHFIKDLSIALTEAEQMKLNLPGLTL